MAHFLSDVNQKLVNASEELADTNTRLAQKILELDDWNDDGNFELTDLTQEFRNLNLEQNEKIEQLDNLIQDQNDAIQQLTDLIKERDEANQKLTDTSKKLEQSEKTLSKYGSFLESGYLSDVVAVADGKEFQVHKVILSFQSPVFAAMFQHEFKEKQESRVEIPDVDKDVCEEMLRYIYTGKLDNLEKYALELLQVADKYQLSELKSQCEKLLPSSINVKTAFEILLVADRHQSPELKQQCTEFIESHFNQIKITEDWKRLAPTGADLALAFYLKLG